MDMDGGWGQVAVLNINNPDTTNNKQSIKRKIKRRSLTIFYK
jgi:hypothetical protein